jgi:MerR family transcriptional regulator, copper efflux regulator
MTELNKSNAVMTTAALCAAAQVTRGTLRLYESQGLIPPPKRSAAGYRHYPASEVLRLQAIRHLKEIGFTLKEIALLLHEREQGDLDPARVRELAQAQMLEIDARIARLQMVRQYVAMVADGDTNLIDDPDCNFLLDFMAAGNSPAAAAHAIAQRPPTPSKPKSLQD